VTLNGKSYKLSNAIKMIDGKRMKIITAAGETTTDKKKEGLLVKMTANFLDAELFCSYWKRHDGHLTSIHSDEQNADLGGKVKSSSKVMV
jgi:hypothetical protein